MKCLFCRSCLKLDRVDYDEYSFLVWICMLCGRVFEIQMGKTVEVSDEIGNLIRERNGVEKVKDKDD